MTSPSTISRRDLFRLRLGDRTDKHAPTPGPASPARARSRAFPILRPPGAIEEREFLSRCTKCGDCMAACPYDAIIDAPLRFRDAAGTPMIDPVVSPCRMCADQPCIASCETGALSGEPPWTMGSAKISTFDCLAHQGSFCSTCYEHCPVPGAIVRTNGRPVINESACTGCGVCQFACPAPRNAIIIMPNAHRPPGASREEQHV